jgi:cytochrome c peroxidase
MNRRQLGNLGLTSQQEDQIVAFLKTLTDGYTPAAK